MTGLLILVCDFLIGVYRGAASCFLLLAISTSRSIGWYVPTQEFDDRGFEVTRDKDKLCPGA